MTIANGTLLGPYEILAPLGAGGMGEVYRARDTRLGREVAVKVLPQAFASDPDRLRRFQGPEDRAGVQLGSVVLGRDDHTYAYVYGRSLSELFLARGLR